jgi:hypothetical protein
MSIRRSTLVLAGAVAIVAGVAGTVASADAGVRPATVEPCTTRTYTTTAPTKPPRTTPPSPTATPAPSWTFTATVSPPPR